MLDALPVTERAELDGLIGSLSEDARETIRSVLSLRPQGHFGSWAEVEAVVEDRLNQLFAGMPDDDIDKLEAFYWRGYEGPASSSNCRARFSEWPVDDLQRIDWRIHIVQLA